MPFVSQQQRKWMYSTHPKMAEEWEEKTPKNKPLPKKVTYKKSSNKSSRKGKG